MDGLQFQSLQSYNTWVNIDVFLQKQITLNREENIHDLNYGKITSLLPTKIFHDFLLG